MSNEQEKATKEYGKQAEQMSEKELKLGDYIGIILKWKWLIVIGTTATVITAGMLSFMVPKIYEINMIIEPGILGLSEKSGYLYLDTPQNLAEKISKGGFTMRIAEALNLKTEQASMKFKTEVDRRGKSSIIVVTSRWEEKERQKGKEALGLLVDCLRQYYQPIVESQAGILDQQIALKKVDIAKVETERKDLDMQIRLKEQSIKKNRNQIKLEEDKLKDVQKRIEALIAEANHAKANTERLVLQRDLILKNGQHKESDLSLLLYTTTIQQNISYFNELNNQTFNLAKTTSDIRESINKLTSDIGDLETAIDRLNLQKNEGLQGRLEVLSAEISKLTNEKKMISNIKIVHEPEVLARPVKPKKKQIIAIAFVGGLTFFIFSALLLNSFTRKKGGALSS